ncbi:hypothetical protein ES319_A11G296900v1 [Gossypium barbadense]|uniref:Uncharacterized protein n=2 Tax=Gossypium TaxID=3633 RepID=A0A5J5TWK7_GOSBA|nr:hypothetical protein ES319_A11G296900v1 [Gossypium barbadense]TYG96146.1 hypothetical protein ES288_A11G324500v1 [Gossypium darwinii]
MVSSEYNSSQTQLSSSLKICFNTKFPPEGLNFLLQQKWVFLVIQCTRGLPLLAKRRLGGRRESMNLEGNLQTQSCQPTRQ